MGKLVSFRPSARRPKRRISRWTAPGAYGVPNVCKTPRGNPSAWFPVVLVALPLAVGTAVFLAPRLGDGPQSAAAADGNSVGPPGLLTAADAEQAHFPICGGDRRITCVVDGDTIWYEGTKIRIADIDTPEISKPGCAREAQLGQRATIRLQALLNEGPFTLSTSISGPSTDTYGRALRVVTRGGSSLGDTLVAEGLAERWGGPRIAWC